MYKMEGALYYNYGDLRLSLTRGHFTILIHRSLLRDLGGKANEHHQLVAMQTHVFMFIVYVYACWNFASASIQNDIHDRHAELIHICKQYVCFLRLVYTLISEDAVYK